MAQTPKPQGQFLQGQSSQGQFSQGQSSQGQSSQGQSSQGQFLQGQYGVVLVTTGSQAEAEKIAQGLVQAKLAACVNFTPIRSIYTWQGKVQQDEEWQLLIKTDLSQFSALEAKVRELHSYEVPEIIALPILAGSQPYLQWLADNTAR